MEAEVRQVELRDGPAGGRIRETPVDGKTAYLACEEGRDQGGHNGVSAFTAGKNLTAHIPIPATGKGKLAMVHKALIGKAVKKGTR